MVLKRCGRYNLYHAFADVIVPVARTLADYELPFDTTQLVVGHTPTLTHAMPWLDEYVGSNYVCSMPPYDLRGWQFLPYLQALTRKRPIRWVPKLTPPMSFGGGDNDDVWMPPRDLHEHCLGQLVLSQFPPTCTVHEDDNTTGCQLTLPDPFLFNASKRTCLHRYRRLSGKQAIASHVLQNKKSTSSRASVGNRFIFNIDTSAQIWGLTDDYPGAPLTVPLDYPHREVFTQVFRQVIGPQFATVAQGQPNGSDWQSTPSQVAGNRNLTDKLSMLLNSGLGVATLVVRGSESSRETENRQLLQQIVEEALRCFLKSHHPDGSEGEQLASLPLRVVNLAELSLSEQASSTFLPV